MRRFAPIQPTLVALALALALILALAGVLVLALAPSGSARAEDPAPVAPEAFAALYSGFLGGLPLVDIAVSFTDGPQGYRGRLVVESRGLLETLSRLRALVEAEGAWAPGDSLSAPLAAARPRGFSRVYTKRGKAGTLAITFKAPATPDGAPPGAAPLARGFRNGKEDARVPPALRRGVLDPLSAFAVGRRLIRTAKAGDSLTLPLFDGKVRFDVVARIGTETTTLIDRRRVAVVPVALAIRPISGFSDRHRESWESLAPLLFFSTDGRWIPLKLEVAGNLGAFVATHRGACDALARTVSCPEPQARYGR